MSMRSFVTRQKIFSYKKLSGIEAFEWSSHYPIIASCDCYQSLHDLHEIIYKEPDSEDIYKGGHGMVIVGNATVKKNDEIHEYFIMQNSWTEDFGYKGFVMIKRTANLNFEFWIPIINQNMLQQIDSTKHNPGKKKRSRQVQSEDKVIGASVFAHEPGLHQDGILENRNTHEIVSPEDIGLVRTNESGVVLGKLG
ncbi:uncharacterized protein [Henckelia pumila]|uniref:uncharacterized protein n=1 Tax=Henckelia pumila TaxID=405737 RepID=UPI003C6E3A0C